MAAALGGVAASFPHSKAEKIGTVPMNLRMNRVFVAKCSNITSSSSSTSLSEISVKNSETSMNESKRTSLSALELLKTSAGNRYSKEKSSIVVIGLNYHTAPLEIREKLAVPELQLKEAISELCSLNHIEEAAVLSTCNRMEIYVVALSQHRGVKEVTEWMSKMSGVPFSDICQHRFLLYNKDATDHLFEVSSGLDSVVLGEGQILSQVKQVVKSSEGSPGFGRKISGLFKRAITVGKRVRTETDISTGSVSVSSAAVELALTKVPESSFANIKVSVVGAGKMGKIVIKHLVSKGCKKMVVVNRTEARVASIKKELKDDVEITYKPLSELLACAAEADVIFTSTASESVLLSKEQVEKFPPRENESQGNGKRLFFDISVPRNVEASVSDLEYALVYNVDDLKEVVNANKEDRLQKANEARYIINEEVENFEKWKHTLETVPTIKKLRSRAERIRVSRLEKCFSEIGDDLTKKQKEAIYGLAMGMMNDFIHGPTQHLRCDGSENRCHSEILENMQALTRMYELDTDIFMLEEKIRAKIGQKKN